jgi:glycine/D-amino acid oxidase-like deaminating enzyme
MEDAQVHVIGGGLGGLAAAAFVARSGHSVVVHEGRGRLGGRATTDRRRGYRFNQGPHALYLDGEAAAVLRDLGIPKSGRTPRTSGARMSLGGRLYHAPGGLGSLLRTTIIGVRDKLELASLMARLPRLVPSDGAGRTVDGWLDEMTDRERVRALLHAIVRLTTYVNAPDQLSAEVAIRQVQLGLGGGVRYLDGGWERLVDGLADVVVANGGEIRLDDGTNEVPDAAAVIVAVGGPAPTAAVTGYPYRAGVAGEAAVLDLALRAAPAHRFVIGVDEPIYLSDHGSTEAMCPPGRASVSLAQYLTPGEEPDRGRLEAFARRAGIASGNIVDERYLHRMTTVSAIATAESGGLAGRPSVAVPDREGVFVVGDWVGPTGHLADAVLASARSAADAAIARVSTLRRVP